MAAETNENAGQVRGRPSSIRVTMTLWNVVILALVLSGFGVALRYTMQEHIAHDIDQGMARFAHDMQRRMSASPNPSQGIPPWMRHRLARQNQNPNSPLSQYPPALLDLDKQRLAPFSAAAPWDALAFNRAAQGKEVYSTVRIKSERIRVFSVPINRDGRVIGIIQVPHNLADISQALAWVNDTLWTLIPLALLIAGLGGAFLTSRALRPVRQIAQAAERIEAQNLSGRLPVMGHDEFAELAITFNHMLERLEGAFRRLEESSEQQRRFTADASHELKTPLTIIKANASLSLSGERSAAQYTQSLSAINQAADRMNRLVQDLLLLARSDADQWEMPLKKVLIADVLDEANEAVRLTFGRPAIIEATASLSVQADYEMLVRLFTNLLANSVRHTPPEGRIAVTAQALPSNRVAICVADSGEGIAAEHLAHLTERFYRVDSARSSAHGGTGLGLAICQTIVSAHRGEMAIESKVGAGTKVTVTLPASPPSPASSSANPQDAPALTATR